MDDLEKQNQIEEFLEEFQAKHSKLLKLVAAKYVIPNRYSVEDIVHHFLIKIMEILKERIDSNNPIENWEKYFKSCLDFYGIEFQRMHGFIFGLPKRPRRPYVNQENEAKQRKFKYWDSMTEDELNSDQFVYEEVDPPYDGSTEIWENLMSILDESDRVILECIYIRGLTWAQTAEFVQRPQSTCWFKCKAALEKIKSHVQAISPDSAKTIKKLLRNDPEAFDGYFG